MGDAELLSRWCTGDVLAGDVLVTRHYAAVYRFFRNKAPDAVDDLTQRTFSACAEGRARFGARASFRTYLFGIIGPAHCLPRCADAARSGSAWRGNTRDEQ